MLDLNNTLIVQVDTKRKKYFVEYGKLADFQNLSEQHWFLLGHVSPSGDKFNGLKPQLLSESLIGIWLLINRNKSLLLVLQK